ncbi:MAG: orotidine 5'-phosphate decarboxylase [Candidatus Entotheonella factor]|uniref:Orotidine 5'-phosphate decarboxylase n=2 Tax=Candidatus Entotheonella TaxID=93171 RepID=W4LFL8_ENTF1|nr:MAG: orotidine 5'-phosphate decarboxylase [Candidatus Entotheonella factor]
MASARFADRLFDAIERKESPVVVGLDPQLDQLPAFLRRACQAVHGATAQAVAEALWHFNRTLIDAVYDLVPAVKPQLAFYERYGVEGLRAYVRTVRYARDAGLLVIADGKRNDIGSTAAFYADAFLGQTSLFGQDVPAAFGADALTVNGYLGSDGIAPFVERAESYGTGLFVLVKTSNPSSGDVQDLEVCGRPLYEHMGALVERWGESTRGACGYSSVGAVVGATYPEQGRRLRALMPHTLFLVPGYGAQGATASDVAGCFDAQGRGAVVNASRSICFAFQREPYASRYGAAGYGAAARAATEQMRKEIQQALHRR